MADEVKQYTHQNFAGIATSSGTKTSHSITILNGDNKTIGMIHSWQASRNRTVTRIHELNANTAGQAVDLVPGVVGTDQITISRYALWKSDLFYAIGESKDGSKVFNGTPGSVKDMLQQRQPFEIREVWATPSNNGIAKDGSEDQALKSSLSPEEITELSKNNRVGGPSIVTYYGCWFVEINSDAFASQGDKAVSENATIEVLGRSYA